MNRPHPNQTYAVAAAILIAASVCGCRGQQTAMSNPFLSPDRVPPPSTRTVAPGTAQPYYPGDPLPVTQSAAPPAAQADSFVASAPSQSEEPAANTNVVSNESPVSIPGDNNDLRFALPSPPAVAEATPQPQVRQPTPASSPILAVSQSSSVAPALYNQADPYQVTPAEPAVAENGPWRSPQIAQASSTQAAPVQTAQPALAQTTPAHPMAVQQPAIQPASQPVATNTLQPVYWIGPQPTQPTLNLPSPPSGASLAATQPLAPQKAMPVEMRAVPSPPLDGAASAAPRIRFSNPSAPAMQTAPSPTYAVGQATYVAAQPASGATVSPDGFRPRGSTW